MTRRSQHSQSLLAALFCGAMLVAPEAVRAEEPAPAGDRPAAEAEGRNPEGPRRRGVRPGAGEPGVWARPTPEQTEELIAILMEIQPDRAALIEQARKENPERVNEMIRESGHRLLELALIRRSDPDLFKLRVEDYKIARSSVVIARDLRKAKESKDDAKAKELDQQLRKKLEDHFNVRQQIRERELARLQKQVEALRERCDAKKKNKDDVIKKRYEELTEKADQMDW